jgi:HNH endonuclease
MRQRHVLSHLPMDGRQCLYCLANNEAFTQDEHVVQRAFGEAADKYILRPGAACDPCNSFLGHQVDAPFIHRYDISLVRGLEGISARGGVLKELECVGPTGRLDIEIKPGVQVSMYVNEFEETANGGFRVRIRPKQRDPDDIVARTIRALWKIALGVMRGYMGRPFALDPQWDGLREAILGAPFSGYLIQAPFRAVINGALNVNIEPQTPELPSAVTFQIGGVVLAAPLVPNTTPPNDDEMKKLRSAGWTVMTTEDPPPNELFFELEPTTDTNS